MLVDVSRLLNFSWKIIAMKSVLNVVENMEKKKCQTHPHHVPN